MSQNTPHKHAAIIKQWADGAEVQYKSMYETEFCTVISPAFCGIGEYRVKPESVSYRVAILKYGVHPAYFCVCHAQAEEKTAESLNCFVRWAGDRQTVEV